MLASRLNCSQAPLYSALLFVYKLCVFTFRSPTILEFSATLSRLIQFGFDFQSLSIQRGGQADLEQVALKSRGSACEVQLGRLDRELVISLKA